MSTQSVGKAKQPAKPAIRPLVQMSGAPAFAKSRASNVPTAAVANSFRSQMQLFTITLPAYEPLVCIRY